MEWLAIKFVDDRPAAAYQNSWYLDPSGSELEVRLAIDMTAGAYTNLVIPRKAAQTVILANWESAINPSEIVRIDAQSKTHKRLTEFNVERAAQIDWQPLRHFWFNSSRGKKIHSMVALPSGFDEKKKYPLLVLMHGGPHSMWRDQFFLLFAVYWSVGGAVNVFDVTPPLRRHRPG